MPSSPYTVAITDRQKSLKLDQRRLVRVARSVLSSEGVLRADISVALVDNREMHVINRNFLRHDYPTDVLSFLLDEEPSPRGKKSIRARAPRGAGKSLDGEVIISTEYARAEADLHDWEPESEVLLYLVHGLLHLCGYDDVSDAERRVMRAREIELLSKWKLVPPYTLAAGKTRKRKLQIEK